MDYSGIYLSYSINVVCSSSHTLWITIILSLSNRAHQRIARATHCIAKLHFISPKLWPQQTEVNSADYITRFMESQSSKNMSCKSAILKESISD